MDSPWSEASSRFTLLFERFAIDLLLATQVQDKAAQILRLSPGQMHDLMKRAVIRGMNRRDAEELRPQLSLDEKAVHQGHSYIAVLGDQRQDCVLDIVEGRTGKSAEELLRHSLSLKQRKGVRSVTMDRTACGSMFCAFLNACHRVIPQADVVHDLFPSYQAMRLGAAVDQTRRAECRINLTPKQRQIFQELRQADLETARAGVFKESFRHLFSFQTAPGRVSCGGG